MCPGVNAQPSPPPRLAAIRGPGTGALPAGTTVETDVAVPDTGDREGVALGLGGLEAEGVSAVGVLGAALRGIEVEVALSGAGEDTECPAVAAGNDRGAAACL